MDSAFFVPVPDPAGDAIEHRIGRAVLRLVKGGPERRAIAAGQADAILDPASGSAYLLPRAQRWLLDRAVRQNGDEAEDRARASLDGLVTQVGVLDASGVVLSANRAWRNDSRACLGASLAEGANYLAACDDAGADERLDATALAAGIRQVIAGERLLFRYEHACTLASGRCWFAFSITRAIGNGAARAVVSREDITARKQHELLLGLEYAVARELAEAADSGAGIRAVIRAVCETLGWDCGRYFRYDAAASVLSHQESWGVPTVVIERFLEASRGSTLHPGAGLNGRVYRSGQPLWILPGSADAGVSPLALAPETETDGAFIFPALFENRTVGVLAFSGPAVREPDDRMLHAVRAIGSQLGRFIHRQTALDLLYRNEARFRRLTELSTDWYWELDRELRFSECVGANAPGVGDCLGKHLWDLPGIAAGTDWAAHRAQLGERWSFCDFEFGAVHADGQPGYYSISGEPVFDAAGTFTGYWGTGMDITRRKRAELALHAAAGAAAP